MDATAGIAQVSTLATHTALTAWSATSDIIIILVILAALFLFAWYVGRGQFIALLLSLYGASAVYFAFLYKSSYHSFLPSAPPLTALLTQVGLYGALALLFYIILRRVVVSDFLYIGIFGLAALSFLGAAFLIALAYHVFPVASVYQFTPALDMLFASKDFFFWWFVAPAIGLFFLAR